MQPRPGILIPHERLEPDTLRNLIEEFVTRDGTELTDGATKVAQVSRLLASGRAVVWFDEATRTCSIALTDSERPT